MIRRARPKEAQALTQLAFAAKAHWQYPAQYLQIWRKELTVTAEFIRTHAIFVYEENSKIAGYYSLVDLDSDEHFCGIRLSEGTWLEHMFVLPELIGHKIGTRLFSHMAQYCRTCGTAKIKILADPNARGFYEKMGCKYIEEYPSTIPGRTTPYLEYRL